MYGVGIGSPGSLGSTGSSWLSPQALGQIDFSAGMVPAVSAPTANWGDMLSSLGKAVPYTGEIGGFGTKLGLNMGTAQLALGGLQSLGNLLSSFQSQSMAKKQFEFAKEFANTNLANQLKSYNTRLEDRINARAVTQGEAPGWADDYIQRNRMTR